jgi:hypothetical protein
MGKITDEELKRLETVKNKVLEVASILGELNYQKIVIDDQIDQQKDSIRRIKKEESDLFEELKSKYGNISINIQTGEFS